MKNISDPPGRGRPRGFDREQALAAAVRVFWSKGYLDASMADLTQAMGINAPSLYAAFGSKENLFREAVRLYTDSHGATLWSCMAGAATAREAIEGLLLATAAAVESDGPKGCLLTLSSVTPDSLPEAACGEVRQLRAEAMAAMRDRLQAAQASGELGPDADPAAIAAFYSTVQQGMTFRAREGATTEELAATGRAAILAWDGLARKTTAQQPT